MNPVKYTLKALGGVALLGALALSAAAATNAVKERIKPVGEVCMAGEPCAGQVAAVSATDAERTGEQVYSTACMACHTTGAAGAPKLGDEADWTARMEARGLDGMYKSAIEGFQAMPAMGLCMDCSESEMKASVDYLLIESGQSL